jgi:hypothetical protein
MKYIYRIIFFLVVSYISISCGNSSETQNIISDINDNISLTSESNIKLNGISKNKLTFNSNVYLNSKSSFFYGSTNIICYSRITTDSQPGSESSSATQSINKSVNVFPSNLYVAEMVVFGNDNIWLTTSPSTYKINENEFWVSLNHKYMNLIGRNAVGITFSDNIDLFTTYSLIGGNNQILSKEKMLTNP